MTSIPFRREIYTLDLNGQKFTLYLDGYWGLILRTDSPINAEILHSQIWYTSEDKYLDLPGTGWHLTRFRNEAVEDLNRLSEQERQRLSIEFGLPICTNHLELPHSNAKSFLASTSAIKIRGWIKMHPKISKRMLNSGEKVKEVFELLVSVDNKD